MLVWSDTNSLSPMYRFLELRIPPPLVALICAALMWCCQTFVPILSLPQWSHNVAPIVLFIAGISIDLIALLSFKRARTTITPLDPSKSTALVTSGIYGISRNPMYLGLGLLLTAWCFLSG